MFAPGRTSESTSIDFEIQKASNIGPKAGWAATGHSIHKYWETPQGGASCVLSKPIGISMDITCMGTMFLGAISLASVY